MSTRRLVPIVLGVLLMVAGLAGFLLLEDVLADVVCGVAIVAGIVVVRLGSRPASDEIV
jgi:hypothetical protein